MNRSKLSIALWVLLCANGVFFVWSQGYLTPLGFGKANPGEPQRLGNQIRPEAIVVVPAQATASLPTSTSASAPAASR